MPGPSPTAISIVSSKSSGCCSDAAAGPSDEQAAYLLRMQQIGQQVAELHLALASRDDMPDFAPEPITAEDVAGWIDGVLRRAEHVFGELARRRPELPERGRPTRRQPARIVAALPERLAALMPAASRR